VLECWSVGVLECWSVGVLECWSVGGATGSTSLHCSITPLLHHSTAPSLHFSPPRLLLERVVDFGRVLDSYSSDERDNHEALPEIDPRRNTSYR
jgi:hypothetical protein